MFEQSLVLAGPSNRWPMVSSLMIQAVGVCVLLVVPLIWVERLPPIQPLPPEVFAPRILPPAMKVFASGVIRSMTAPRLTTPRVFRAPVTIPTSVNMKRDVSFADPLVPGSIVGVDKIGNGFPGDFTGELPTTPPPPPKQEAAKPTPTVPASIRVSSAIQASKLIHQVKPPYPALAVQTRTQGVVRLHAIIARDGSIQQLQVLMGHPLLVQSAVDAVKQWRYSPTLLNGQPVEVLTQIDVNFTLAR